MKETQEFEELVKKTENLLLRIERKMQRASILKNSLHYDPVSELAPPELLDAEETIDKLKSLQEKWTKALSALKGGK